MKLNWKVRVKNKAFWLAIIPANRLIAVVNALFACLSILGVVSDPTTPGVADSDRAMSYTAPGVADTGEDEAV